MHKRTHPITNDAHIALFCWQKYDKRSVRITSLMIPINYHLLCWFTLLRISGLIVFFRMLLSFKSFCIALCPVDFMFRGKKVRVKGRFPLRNPWWEISCNAQQYSRKLVVNGYPSYTLRTNLKNDSHTLVSLFLKECDVAPDFVTRFMEWLPKDRYVELMNVEEALCDFGKSINSKENETDYVKSQISLSGIGRMLLKCLLSNTMQYFFPPTVLLLKNVFSFLQL